jgi:hypothetical protein
VGEGFFVEVQIQARSPIPKQFCQPLPEWFRADYRIVPSLVDCFKTDTIRAPECCVDKFVLDTPVPEIHELTVPQFGQ